MQRWHWERWEPPGVDVLREIRWILAGWALSALYSLRCAWGVLHARDALFQRAGDAVTLRPGAVMPDFVQFSSGALLGYALVAACMIPLAAAHFASHWQGSRSIDLMRRLPQRGELWRRCLALPAAAAAGCAALALLTLAAHYGFYRLCTPEPCLTDGQWLKFLTAMRGG